MKTKRLFISTLIAAAAMGFTAYANEAATQTTPVIAETDAPEGADKLLPLADAPAAEEADAAAEETQDADALELLLADDAIVELDEASAPDELSTETMMREWIARYAAAARFAGIRSVKGTGGGLSSGGAVATAGADFAVSAAAPTPSVSVPAAGTVSLADTLTRASAAGVSLGSASASDAGTASVATASSTSGTGTILPAAFFSTRSVFSAVPAAAASYSLAGSSGVSAYAAGDDTTDDSDTTIQSTWPSDLIDSFTGRPTASLPGFGTATLNASSLTLSGNTTVTISGNPGSAINIDTAGHLLAVVASGDEVQFNGKFMGSGAVWFKQGRFQARNPGFFGNIGDVHVSEASQLQLSAATMNIANNFFLGTTSHSESQAALRVGVWANGERTVNAVLSGVTTVLAEGTKIGFQYGSTLDIQQLTGSGNIDTVNHASGGILKISGVTGDTGYTGKINLVSGVTLNWTNATATFGGLSNTAGSAGSVAGGSYLNIAKANNDSTSFAGTVGAAGNGVALNLTGSGTQAFTGTNYFSSVSVGAGATLDLSGSTTTLSSSILNSGTVTVTSGTTFNITSLASLKDTEGNYAVISGGTITDWNNVSESNFLLNGTALSGATIGRYKGFAVGTDGKITFTETAANLVWTNAANGTWDTSTRNWTNTSTSAADAFVNYDSVEFNKSGTYTVTVASGGVTADIMKVSAGTVSFSGGTVTAIGGVSVTGGTLNLPTNVFAAGTAFNVSGGALTLGSAFALTAGTSIDVTDAGMVSGTISSMAAGSSLRLAGKTASTVTLAGTIGAAALDIQNGSLTWTHNGTSRSSAANITIGAGSTFKDVTDYKYSLTLSGTLLGSGTLYSSVPTQSGQNDGFRDVTLSGNASGFTGEWVLETASSNSGTNNRRINGVLNVSGGVFGGVINFANSSANAAGISSKLSIAQATMEIGGLKGTLSNTQVVSSTTSSALTINTVADADYTYAGQIASSISSITKNGDGIQTLSGDNSSYTGAIMVNAGTLGAGSANALGSGAVTVKDGATLAREMENESVQIGNGTKSGSLTTEGAAILNLGAVSADTAAIAVTGEVTLSAGTIFDITDASVGGAILLSGTSITISDGGSLSKSNIYVNGYKLNQRATLTVTTENGQIAISDYTEGNNIALTWNGGVNGVWKADGAGWTATDTSEEATFQHGDDVTFSTGTNNNVTIAENLKLGTLTTSAATTLSVADGSTVSVFASALSLGANLTLNSGITLAVTTFASSIDADSTVDYSNLSGTGTLSLGLRNDNGVGFNLSNFEGTIRVERGTGVTAASRFQLNTSTLNANARIVVADGNDLVFNDDTNKNVSNSVTFEGSGTIHVNGDNDITSGTNVCTGTLSGNVVVAGTLTKAGGGVLTLSGNASISALGVSGGTLNLNGTQNVGTSLTANSGTINIGSGWTLTSTSSVGGTVNIEDRGVWEVVGQNNSTSRIVGKVNVKAGGTLNIAGHDALGYNTNGAMTNATIVAQGEEGNLARIVIADVSGSAGASMTFGQTFRLNGYTEVLSGVSGSSFNTFFGSVVATGTNNTISSEVKLRKAFTVQVTAEGDELEISGVLSKHTDGNNGLTKTGSGTLVLSGANTYDCATTIEGGVLTVKNSSALGTGVLNAAGGTGVDSVTLKVAQDSRGNALTIANNISVSADKTLILESANDGNKLTGTISGENGTLKLASGTLEIAGASSLKLVKVGYGAVLKFSGETTSIVDTTDGALVDGGGKLVFSSRTATVSRIILNSWNDGATSTARALAEVSGGVVNVTSVKEHAISIGSGASTQSHTLTISGGVLNATAGTTTLGYSSAGTLELTGGEANLKGIAFGESSASGTLEVSNARLNLGESGIEKKAGAGTGSVSFGEGAIIGALDWWSSAANVGISLAGAVIFDTTKRVASTSSTATVSTTETAGTTITLAGALSGSGPLTKVGAGTLKLTGDNSAFTGNVKLSAGTLEIGHSNALGLADPYRALTINGDSELKLGGGLNVANNVVFDHSATEALTLTINAAADTELSGMLSSYAQNEIRKIGAGTLKLSGNNELFSVGTISVEEGTILAAQANALGKGTVTVGADGKLGIEAGVTITEVSGGIVLAKGAQIVVDLSNRLSETATFEVTLATDTAISLAAEAALAYSEGGATDLTDYLELKGWNKSGWTSSLTYADNTLKLTMAIPEPSLFGLLAGVTALGFSMSSRRRRKKA